MVRLFRWGHRQLELVLSPPGTFIPKHVHVGVDGLIVHVWGRVVFGRAGREVRLPRWSWLRGMRVGAGVEHWARVERGNWFVFLNWERWSGKVGGSVVDDLVLTGVKVEAGGGKVSDGGH